jgi:predicted amino acid dehydrogenase
MDLAMTVDVTSVALSKEVEAAAKEIVEVASVEPGRWWPAYELQTRARNGSSAGAVSLALSRLVDEGKFESGDGDLIRLKS